MSIQKPASYMGNEAFVWRLGSKQRCPQSPLLLDIFLKVVEETIRGVGLW